MDFVLSEEQVVLSELAENLFAKEAGAEQVRAVERDGDGFDRGLWSTLAGAGLVGASLAAETGGGGFGMVELTLLLAAQGRHVAPVPLWPTVVGAEALYHFGGGRYASAVAVAGLGDLVVTLSGASPLDITAGAGGVRLDGTLGLVPWSQHAGLVLAVSDDGRVFVVDPSAPGVTIVPVATTSSEPTADVELQGAAAEVLADADPDAAWWIAERVLVALAALQLGVAEGALAQTAAYVSGREQFGRPLSTFQAVGQSAADAFIVTDAMRATVLQAAWRLDAGLPAAAEVLVAAWWAADGGQQVVHRCQHLHGGMGADVDYPIHRFFLWGMQLASRVGAASDVLARLGQLIATGVGEEA